jgi:hypothetical protein
VSAHRCDLLKHGAHVLGVACHEHPTHMVGWKLRVANSGHALTPHRVALLLNGELGNGGVNKDQQVALTKLREDLLGSYLQSITEVVASSRDKPSHHGRVSGVSRNVYMDLAASKPELTVQVATVCRNPRVAKAVQHVLEQGGKPWRCNPSQRNHLSAPRVA